MNSVTIQTAFRNWGIRSDASASSFRGAAYQKLGDPLDGDPFLTRSLHLFFAGVSARRLLIACLQVVAITFSLVASPRAEAATMRTMALESGLIAGVAICDAWSGDRGARASAPRSCSMLCFLQCRRARPVAFHGRPFERGVFFQTRDEYCRRASHCEWPQSTGQGLRQ